MATRGDDPPPGGWREIVDDLEPPEPDDLVFEELDGSPRDQVELVERPHAPENQGEYAYPPSAPPQSSPSPRPLEVARPAPASGGREAGLSLPRPESRGGASGPPSRSAPLADAVPQALFQESGPAPRRPPRGSSQTPAIVAVALAVLAALGVSAWVVLGPPPPPPTAMVSVVSDPPGAEVLVSGQPIGQVTPAQIYDVELGRVLRVQVRRPGYAAEPPQRGVEVVGDGSATAYFVLTPVRSLEVRTEPAGAAVRLDGRALPGRTPLIIDEVEVGSTAVLEVELEGFLPVRVEHSVTQNGAPLPPIELAEAVRLGVTTSPSGAKVLVDGEPLGETPLYDAPVEKGALVTVRVEKPGYRPVARRIRLERDRELRFGLKEAPLAGLPLSQDEKREARQLDRDLARASALVATARAAVDRAERRLDATMNDPRAVGQARVRAEHALDRALARLARGEEALADLQSRAELLRARALSRP